MPIIAPVPLKQKMCPTGRSSPDGQGLQQRCNPNLKRRLYMKTTPLYQQITDQIIAAIESGKANQSWRMPWHTTGTAIYAPVNAVSRKPYRGVNTLILWATADAKGYASGTWAT